MRSGVLMMDKPRGMTSHDVVAAVRRCLGMRAVGHTGTLDPEASGLLLLCLGRGTKFARFFEALEKTYWAVMRLGVCTDTQDATGSVTRQCDVATVEKAQVETILAQFRGVIQQVPPMYSAVKHRGQRLYHLARQGQIVPRDPREVFIRRLELLHVEGPWVTLSVTCSKGTYIRTLCEDIGLALGYGAHLQHLQRCRIGPFILRHACTLEGLHQQAADGALEALLPLSEALDFLPPLPVTMRQYWELRTGQGRMLPTQLVDTAPQSLVASSYRLCTPSNTTVAVMHRQPTTSKRWKVYQLETEG
jgi:tRNA pseudouridine55 synthase